MAEESSQDESSKTEEPSQRRLEEARKKGQVVQSREINHFFMMLAFTFLVMTLITSFSNESARLLSPFITQPDLYEITGTALHDMTAELLANVALLMAIPLLLFMVAALLPAIVQNKVIFATEHIKPKLEKISPIKGFGRVFGGKAIIEFLKSLLKISVVAWISWLVIAPYIDHLSATIDLSIDASLVTTQKLAARVLIGVTIFLFLLAIGDYLLQRFMFMKQMRMSKQEVKDEYKQQEGDPHIKGKLKQMRRDKARQRMMQNVPTADVVITNPTHFAVALKYEQGTMQAPKVVAKGADKVAFKIRELAEKSKVPIVRNPPLARVLFDTTDIDEEVPYEHYAAVAKVIGYVYKLKGKTAPAKAKQHAGAAKGLRQTSTASPKKKA